MNANLNLIAKAINKYREKLFSFTRRNKEMHYKPSSANISLSNYDIQKALIEAGLTLEPEKIPSFTPITLTDGKYDKLISEGSLILADHYQMKSIPNEKLYKVIEKIRTTDNKYQREFGISGAWLLGPFLLWRQPKSTSLRDMMVTPIFKLPIDIHKPKGKGKSHTLVIEDQDIQLNPTLIAAFKEILNIDLTCIDTNNSAETIIHNLQCHLKDHGKNVEIFSGPQYTKLPAEPAKTKTVTDEFGEKSKVDIDFEKELTPTDRAVYQHCSTTEWIILDNFYVDSINASKLALLEDYDKILSAFSNHPILMELFSGAPATKGHSRPSPTELDAYTERENYFVVDIDSTQHRAIDSIRKSNAIVIQGPPGTGKSQTITNLIADLIAKGEKVLFVSEKRAALDVVYNRLSKAKLENQAVLLHSSDLDKRDLYASFLHQLDEPEEIESESAWTRVTDELDEQKQSLNQYSKALMTTQPCGLSVSDIFNLHGSYSDIKFEPLASQALSHLTQQQLEALTRATDALQSSFTDFDLNRYLNHPWAKRKLTTKLTETNQSILRSAISAVESLDLEIEQAIQKINASSFAKTSLVEFVNNFANYVNSNAILEDDLSFFFNSSFNPKEISSLFLEIDRLAELLRSNLDAYARVLPNANPIWIDTLEEYHQTPRGVFDIFSAEYWQKRTIEKAVLKPHVKRSWPRPYTAYKQYLFNFDQMNTIKHKLNLQDADPNDDIQSSVSTIRGRLKSAQAFAEFFDALKTQTNLSPRSVKETWDLWCHCCDLAETYDLVNSLTIKRNNALKPVFDLLDIDEARNTPTSFLLTLYESITDLPTLDAIDQIVNKFNELSPWKFDIAAPTLCGIKVKWSEYITAQSVKGWHDQVIAQHPSLSTFESSIHQNRVARFQTAVNEHKYLASDIVKNKAINHRTDGIEQQGISLLTREANKKKRILSPREIMEKGALNTMLCLRPCWLMSPLSISQMLPNDMELFDVIIFDEASQVRVEDALPAIFRASKMIVVGDDKQMPPTNFFNSNSKDNDDDDEIEIDESILDLASKVFPSELLEWHYRSRSQELIAFSNRAFYLGRLIAPQAPSTFGSDCPIKFHGVADAFFDPTFGNGEEAKQVVARLKHLLISAPDSSYGIIALGTKQQKAIENAIEERCSYDEVFAELYENALNPKSDGEHVELFVKNLENVQGDERDTILLSVGYAPSGIGKKLRRHFGPLSSSGGGRRLNVAITRAKSNMEVFCSFSPNLLETDEAAFSKSPDSTCFARFLNYVQALSLGQRSKADTILNLFPVGGQLTTRKGSRFSEHVRRKLEEHGLTVASEVGAHGFYVDLAIEHPHIPGGYILGIECDGAVFHSTPYARDRDRTRQLLLEDRGWKIHRIWSQDWSRSPDAEIKKIVDELKSLNNSSDWLKPHG